MPYADIGDVKLHYEIYGSEYALNGPSVIKKPTIISVHGSADQHCYNVPILEAAAEFAQLIFVSNRGYARSIDPNPEHCNLKQWADDLYHFCNTLGLDKPFFYAHSLGGWITQLYAATYQDQAAGIILGETEACLDKTDILEAYEARGGLAARQAAERYFQDFSEESGADYFKYCAPCWSNTPFP